VIQSGEVLFSRVNYSGVLNSITGTLLLERYTPPILTLRYTSVPGLKQGIPYSLQSSDVVIAYSLYALNAHATILWR